LFFAALFCAFILNGCDPATKPDRSVIDTTLTLDQTFEDKEYGFRFSYPSTYPLEKGTGIFGMGTVSLYFSSRQKLDKDAALMTVTWMIDDVLSKTKTQVDQDTTKNGGTLKSFEKIKLADKDCTYIRVAFGGMLDPLGSRIGEQYFLAVNKGSGFIINFSAPADKFESYRPQFNTVLQSFKFDQETVEQETAACNEREGWDKEPINGGSPLVPESSQWHAFRHCTESLPPNVSKFAPGS